MNSLAAFREKLIEKKPMADNIFLAAWALYFCFKFLETTMMYPYVMIPVYRAAGFILILVMFYRFAIIEKHEWKELILMSFILFVGAGMLVFRHTKLYLLWAAAIIAAKDVRFERIVMVSLAIGVSIMLIALAASQVGLTEDLVYKKRGHLAHAFGIVFTTDCAAHVFYLLLGFFYLKRDVLKPWTYIGFAVFTWALFTFTRARNNTICIIILLIATAVYQYIKKKKEEGRCAQRLEHAAGGILAALPVLLVAFSFYNTFCFDKGNAVMKRMDAILGHRYAMGLEALHKYGIQLWGSDVFQRGWGGADTGSIGLFLFALVNKK